MATRWSCTSYILEGSSTLPAPAADAMGETFDQLDELLGTLGTS